MVARRLRVYLITSDTDSYSLMAEDLQEVMYLEQFDFFHVHHADGMEVVHDVFMPDIVLTFQTTLEDTYRLIEFFGTQLVIPCVMLFRNPQRTFLRSFPPNFPKHIVFMQTPFMIEDMLETMYMLTYDVHQDIAWLNEGIAVG